MNWFVSGICRRFNVDTCIYFRKCVSATVHRVYSSKIRYSDSHVKWFAPEEVERMSRRDLQGWCKKLKIRANRKTTELRRDLLHFHRDVLSNSFILKYPFVPVQIPAKHSTPGAPPTLHHEKSLFLYRNADYLNDFVGGSTHGVRHYQKVKYDPDETQEDVIETDTEMFSSGRLPSVTAILRATAPKSRLFAISRWTKKQKALLGEEVFRQKMNEVKRNGSEFHSFIHRCLVDRSLSTAAPARLQGFVESTKEVFGKLGDAIASEHAISHAHLGYKGKIDTIASFNGDPCVIEWKTSERKKSSLEDCGEYPMQVVAYAGAVNSDLSFGIKVKHGLIVIAYKDGSPADVHPMDLQLCRSVWQDWLVRVHEFYNQDSNKNVASFDRESTVN